MKNLRAALIGIGIVALGYLIPEFFSELWTLGTWYETIVLSLVSVFPVSIGTFFLSLYSFRKDDGVWRLVAIGGLIVAAIAFLSDWVLLIHTLV
jgi:hypothetical protein